MRSAAAFVIVLLAQTACGGGGGWAPVPTADAAGDVPVLDAVPDSVDATVGADADADANADAADASVTWTKLVIQKGAGPCPPGQNCQWAWTVVPSGRVEALLQGTPATWQLDAAELQALHALVDPPEIVAAAATCPPPPTDVGVSFTLHGATSTTGTGQVLDVTGCIFGAPESLPAKIFALVAVTCAPEATGEIPGASLDLSPSPCRFSIAAAKGSFAFPYRVIVNSSEQLTLPANAGQCVTDVVHGGVGVFETIGGNGQQWCLCDTGLCFSRPDKDALTATVPGTYDGKFLWDGKNFQGPSDTGMKPGAPFPPGTYTLRMHASGTHLLADGTLAPYGYEATLQVRLDP